MRHRILLAVALGAATFLAGSRDARACTFDTDCPGTACGTEVCSWNTSPYSCVAANTDPGWCGSTQHCKCAGEGATCDTSTHHCTFVTAAGGGAEAGAPEDSGAADAWTSSGSSGSSSGSSWGNSSGTSSSSSGSSWGSSGTSSSSGSTWGSNGGGGTSSSSGSTWGNSSGAMSGGGSGGWDSGTGGDQNFAQSSATCSAVPGATSDWRLAGLVLGASAAIARRRRREAIARR